MEKNSSKTLYSNCSGFRGHVKPSVPSEVPSTCKKECHGLFEKSSSPVPLTSLGKEGRFPISPAVIVNTTLAVQRYEDMKFYFAIRTEGAL